MNINICDGEDTSLDTCIVCGRWCNPDSGICDICDLAFGDDASFEGVVV